MINEIFIYKSDTFDPYINLATEKHLLMTAPKNAAVLMLWQNQNTVVIGINQNPYAECRCTELFESGARLARRETGGGAVFHDLGNLNFSIVTPSDEFDLARNFEVIIFACKMAGINAQISGRNDLTANGFKFSGNAFLHKNGMSLHHGTLLINADFEKMSEFLSPPKTKLSAKGVKSVRSRVTNLSSLSPSLDIDTMSGYLEKAFSEVFGLPAVLKPMPTFAAITKQAEIYASEQFLFGKTFPFTAEFSGRCEPHGEMKILVSVKNGIIDSARVYTDSLDTEIAGKIETLLCTLPYNKSAIDTALENANFKEITDIIKL